MARQDTRQLKIYSQYRDKGEVPQLRLSGKWMERLGFRVGDQVSITTRDQLLIIESLQVSEPEVDYRAALDEVKQTLKKLSG